MKKIIFLLLNVFIALLGINTAAKIIEFHLIFNKIEPVKSIFFMFIFSFSFRLLLIFLYDYRGRDYFKVEWIKQNRDIIIEEKNSLVKRIARLQKIGDFFNRFYYFKWVGIVIFFLVMSMSEPIFVVIYYRDGHHQYNGIPDFKILLFFIFSCLLCSISLFFTFTAMVSVLL